MLLSADKQMALHWQRGSEAFGEIPMTIDPATADYEREQERRAALEDDWAVWAESQQPWPTYPPIPKGCPQCVNWRPARRLHLADGTTQLSPGFCAARAAADLPQMSQDYAERCRFYAEEIPF
ncbi:hypothetical protein [Leptolyngbya sp. BC1307]|uniref:hypothetical protein n=1 Tax=Leptolyngbya sp. BC1307 TaxID=2029589 RepID=UPI001F0AC23A|nr:hypothetical protein [Leptolyngbya sp. BC1307]